MVVKIQNSTKAMAGVLDYNERKVREGNACIIDIQGIQAPDEQSIRNAFAVYERRNIRTENVSFHMSINPGPEDLMTERDIVEFASKMMIGLGYENQPYVIYRHNDIGRPHYHVVSIRVNENGKKIRDRKEHLRCQSLMQELQKEFPFVIGCQEKGMEQNPSPLPVFDRESPSIAGQMHQAFEDALKYHFTTWSQFKHIMEAHGINANVVGPDDALKITLQGLDQGGCTCTAILTEDMLGGMLYQRCVSRMEQCMADKEVRKEKNRIINAVRICTAKAIGEQHLSKLLHTRGIELILSRSTDGSVFGITIVDHTTKCAFKGSELGKDIGQLIRVCLEVPQSKNKDKDAISIPFMTSSDNNDKQHIEKEPGISEALFYAAVLLNPDKQSLQGAGKDPRKKKKKRKI